MDKVQKDYTLTVILFVMDIYLNKCNYNSLHL